MIYNQPSIFIGNLRIDEPVTTLTDLMVSAVCFYAFYKLSQKDNSLRIRQYLKYYFLSMGFATAIGGIIGHAFMYNFSFYWKLPGWLTSMFSIMLIERASIEYSKPFFTGKTDIILKRINLLELTAFVIITMTTLDFFYVEVHSAYGLLVIVTSLNLYIYYKSRSEGSRFFLIAVGFSSVSALIYMNKWGISEWFTHTDISRILMTLSAWNFYKGADYIFAKPELTNSNDKQSSITIRKLLKNLSFELKKEK